MTVEVRTFVDHDRGALRALFGRAGEGSPLASLWGHEESEAAIYLTPYMDLEPGSLLLAFVDGEMVGYLTGCLDSRRFPTEGERFDRAVREHRLFLRPKPMLFFARATVDAARGKVRNQLPATDFDDPRWPAHLHINLVPHARGTGAAPALMGRWFEQLAAAGSPGCHLQTLVENTRAVRFFTRMGFTEYGPAPVVPGIRHDGRRLHQRTMVRPADGT